MWNNAIGLFVSIMQAAIFAGLFLFGNWFFGDYIDYFNWSGAMVAALIAFVLSFVYCGVQVPGKLLLAKMSAFRPYFSEAANALPRGERVAFARKCSRERLS